MSFFQAIRAAFITIIEKAVLGAGEMVSKKVEADFGGEHSPEDERQDILSSALMEESKRKIWEEINIHMNDNGGDGPIAGRLRKSMATKRRMNFAALMQEIPTIKTEFRNSAGKVVRTTYTSDPNAKPEATKVKERCVDMFLFEKQAQITAKKGEKKATEIAQLKVEMYLNSCGFPVPSERHMYHSVDEFIVKVPETAVKAAIAVKTRLTTLLSKAPAAEQAVRDRYNRFITHTDNYDTRKKNQPGLVGWVLRFLP